MRFVVGIDEAGRGPLAGPVSVGAVIVPRRFNWRKVDGVRDSKQLTPRAREQWYRILHALRQRGDLNFTVSFVSAIHIDNHGITSAVRMALARVLRRLQVSPDDCEVLLDGSLHAPKQYTTQKTIIRGDVLEPIISM